MSKKKIIILSAIFIFSIIVIILGSYLSKGNPSSVSEKPSENSEVFPESEQVERVANTGIVLPPEGSSSTQALRNNTSYIYSPSSNKDILEKEIEKSFQEKNYSENVNWMSYATENGEQISLNDFSLAAGIDLDQNLMKFIDEYNYDRFVCKNQDGSLDYGLIINNKFYNNYPELSQDQTEILRAWEPTMLEDLSKILYPNIPFSQAELSQPLSFKDGRYRYAEISLPEGKKGSINYHLLVDSIIFANSPSCMDQVSQLVEEIQ